MKDAKKEIEIQFAIETIILRLLTKHGLTVEELINNPYFCGYMQGLVSGAVIWFFGPEMNMDRQKIIQKVQDILKAAFAGDVVMLNLMRRGKFQKQRDEVSIILLIQMVEFQRQRNTDFIMGYENAGIVAAVISDTLDDENLPSVVIKARQRLHEQGINPDDSDYINKLQIELHQLLLFDYFKKQKRE